MSLLGVLANKTPDTVTLSSCWTVVDCDWLIKCKHLFCLFSHLTMPDIFSCAGTALRVWSVGSVERGTALCDFFFNARNMGVGRFFFVNLKSKTLLNDCYSFCPHAMSSPQRAIIKRFIPFRLFWCLIQCRLVFLNWRLLGVFCVRKYAPSAWSWISIPNTCVCPSPRLSVSLFNSCLASKTKHREILWCYTLTWFQYPGTRGHFFCLLNVLLFQQ